MKTNLEPMPLYKRPRLQHMKRLVVTALTAVMLSGLVAGCDVTDPVASRVIVAPPPPVDDGGDDGRDDGGRDDNAPACPSPSTSLVGMWDLIGHSNNGSELEVSGTWLFLTNGTLTIQATIDGRDSSGEFTYHQNGPSVAIGQRGQDVVLVYSLSFCGNEATLTKDFAPFRAPLIYTLRSIH